MIPSAWHRRVWHVVLVFVALGPAALVSACREVSGPEPARPQLFDGSLPPPNPNAPSCPPGQVVWFWEYNGQVGWFCAGAPWW